MTSSIPNSAKDIALDVRNVAVEFKSRKTVTRVIDGVSFTVGKGEIVGIVGESGSGKSVTMLSLVGLLPNRAAVSDGEADFFGRDLLQLDAEALRRLRGSRIGFVFQDPLNSLNPVMTIGAQLAETLKTHRGMNAAAAAKRSVELLETVGIAAPTQRLASYPHEMSGGMRQRVMIAMGIACNPDLLIADEPTTALDVTIQRQVVDLVVRLSRDMGMAVVWITHDLSLLAQFADRIVVMYSGRVVEEGLTSEVYQNPQHPYTEGLIRSIPRFDSVAEDRKLPSIPGAPPDPAARPPGCAFAPRCSYRIAKCQEAVPPLMRDNQRSVACFVRNANTLKSQP